MTEDRLQFEIVTWFHNSVPEERGFLCRTENKTNKGARDKGLGLVKGMSDLRYTAPCNSQVLFELKAPGSRHPVDHLKQQLNFIHQHSKRGAIGFFVFSLDRFQTIIANIVPNGVNLNAINMANHSIAYIRKVVNEAELKRQKTVFLDYDYKDLKI